MSDAMVKAARNGLQNSNPANRLFSGHQTVAVEIQALAGVPVDLKRGQGMALVREELFEPRF